MNETQETQETQGTGTQGAGTESTEIPEFQFSKLWTNAADFPTVEMNETQVREDMQRLHSETRDYINAYLRAAANAVTALEARVEALEAIAQKIWFGTQAQYDAITVKESETMYCIEEATSS